VGTMTATFATVVIVLLMLKAMAFLKAWKDQWEYDVERAEKELEEERTVSRSAQRDLRHQQDYCGGLEARNRDLQTQLVNSNLENGVLQDKYDALGKITETAEAEALTLREDLDCRTRQLDSVCRTRDYQQQRLDSYIESWKKSLTYRRESDEKHAAKIHKLQEQLSRSVTAKGNLIAERDHEVARREELQAELNVARAALLKLEANKYKWNVW